MCVFGVVGGHGVRKVLKVQRRGVAPMARYVGHDLGRVGENEGTLVGTRRREDVATRREGWAVVGREQWGPHGANGGAGCPISLVLFLGVL